MTVFNLLTFPNVCRACLQSVHPEQMMTLDTHRPVLDGTIGAFLQGITFPLPDNVLPYLPNAVCIACMEVMEFFSKYRRKMNNLHEFLVALACVKLGNERPLRELFESKTKHLELLFRDLDLCNVTEAGVDDLLQEYDQYMIASMEVESGPKKLPVIGKKQNAAVEVRVELEESVEVWEDSLDSEQPAQILEDTVELVQPAEILKDKVKLEQLAHNLEDPTSFEGPTEERQCSDISSAYEREPNELIPVKQNQRKKRKIIQTRMRSRIKTELELEADNDSTPSDENEATHKHSVPGSTNRIIQSHEPYHCDKCSYKTYHTVAFTLHTKKHELNEGKDGFVCKNPYCLRMFTTKEELMQHKRSNPHDRYTCEICGNELMHRLSLEVHMERHVGITRFECAYCSASFHTRTELLNHLTTIHISDDRAECHQCSAVFKSKKLLKQHLDSHTVERNFRCGKCDRAFKTQHQLNRHTKAVHTDDARFQCDHCTVSYSRRDKLRLHMEKTHGIQTYFVCDICVRSFDSNEALQEHRYHHEHPKQLECGTCLIVCLDADSFDRHTCITYQDNYVCCGRDFKYHMLYNKHMMSHGIKVNARVKPNMNLLHGQQKAKRVQTRVKSTEKPHIEETRNSKHLCTMCGKCFSSVDKRNHHGCEVPEREDDSSMDVLVIHEEELEVDDPA